MSARLAKLVELVASGHGDSFARYALALEYKKAGAQADALRTFEELRAADPNYLAMYYMAGRMLLDLGRDDEARAWLEQGIAVATAQGNSKTLSELEGALAEI